MLLYTKILSLKMNVSKYCKVSWKLILYQQVHIKGGGVLLGEYPVCVTTPKCNWMWKWPAVCPETERAEGFQKGDFVKNAPAHLHRKQRWKITLKWPRSTPGFEGQMPSITFSGADGKYNKRIFMLSKCRSTILYKQTCGIRLPGNILSDQN